MIMSPCVFAPEHSMIHMYSEVYNILEYILLISCNISEICSKIILHPKDAQSGSSLTVWAFVLTQCLPGSQEFKLQHGVGCMTMRI